MGIPVFFASHNSAAGPGKAPGLAWPDEGTRACGEGDANMEGRLALCKAHCWRGPTKGQGLAGCKAPTWKAARHFARHIVGAARRWNKGLRDARRQHGRPPGALQGALLAWPNEGTRACGEGDANMEGRLALFKAHCWRSPTMEQGIAGCKAPTWCGRAPGNMKGRAAAP